MKMSSAILAVAVATVVSFSMCHADVASQDSEAALAAARKNEEKELAANPNTWGWGKFGEWSYGPEQKATGAYRVEKVNGKWWLVAPNGRLMWSHGLVGVAYPDDAIVRGKYGSDAAFADVAHQRARSWGFNAIGGGSDSRICALGRTAYAAKDAPSNDAMNFGNVGDIVWIDGCDGEKPLKEILPKGLDKPVILANVKFGAKDHAKNYAKFVRAAMAHPAVVGVHACRFSDDGKGLFPACTDERDTPREDMIAAARSVGYKIYETRWNAAGDDMHPDLIGYRRCIPMEGFLRTDPGLRQIGLFRTRESSEIKSSLWSVGCECLDRDYGDFDAYKGYLGKTGAKRARFQSGWAKTEKEKGRYDFEWLDRHLRYAAGVGVKPWVCIAYGNPIYKSGLNIGTGVATIVENPETLEAWLKYCVELVRRYGDIVDEWEIWNEPFGKQMDDYYKLLVKTSEAIHSVQPRAKIMVSAVGTVENAKELLAKFVANGNTDAIQSWHIHPYIANPDKVSDEWWGLDSVDEFCALLAQANPKIRLVQGETGCPAQLEYTHALSLRSWSEYSQAKWDLRSMANYAVRGIPYSVFSIVDNKYADMLQSFGMLRANLHRGVVYARPKYFACRNMFSFFDDGVKPVGMVQADFQVLEKRIPQFDMPSRDEPIKGEVPYAVNVARFEKAGTPVLLAWYSHRIPSDALVFDTVKFSVPGVSFKDPVWMDMITGRVFEIDANDIETKNGTTIFKRLPIWDSPVLLAERGQVELKQ